MASSKSNVASLKIMNQDLVKLDRFDGTNYKRWADKMMFLLTALKISYILDPKLEELPKPTVNEDHKLKERRKQREEDALLCRGHILQVISDRLFDRYSQIESAKEIWKALEFKYKVEEQGTSKYLISKYLEFKMVDDKAILDQCHEMETIVNQMSVLEIKFSETFQVGAIIAKLPPSWKNYQKKLINKIENFTLEQLQRNLRIEEKFRVKDKKEEPISKSNVIENKPIKKAKKAYGNEKKKGHCYVCEKIGHFDRTCRNRKKDANVVEEFIAMVTEVNAVDSISGWWLDSDAIIHICKDRSAFKSFEETTDGQEVQMGNPNRARVVGKEGDKDKVLNKTPIELNEDDVPKTYSEDYSTPHDTSMKLSINSGRAIAQLEYDIVIGSLMYAMHCTRPDIAYVVCKLSRYTSNPGAIHWKAIGRILRYLKLTIAYELKYNEYPNVLEGYCDASWMSSCDDLMSTSGWIFTLGGSAISWASKKQTCISHSTMESEFIALATSQEAEWIRNLLLDIKFLPNPMPPISIHCDTEATLSRAYNNIYNGKSRHISLRHQYVKELIQGGIITITYVRSSKNLADPLTKGLSKEVASKKQPNVSRSSAEAEYRALALAASEVSWVLHLLKELQVYVPRAPTICAEAEYRALALATSEVSWVLHLLKELQVYVPRAPTICAEVEYRALALTASEVSWVLHLLKELQVYVPRAPTICAEAEYRGLALAASEVSWVLHLLKELQVYVPRAPTIWCV
ncbi:hypothetical protein H6P81_006214 [Aristolochia fimbriata]|uniref:CCHC-type domain-containing protein n=1 Tax=Aristolochia fimbriata TaxID=158543 RepID=A0AAV7EYV5_ARIFI|nr:hypothetical protein H6P81_006214 [Aristolochia fimbriata]